MSDSPGFRRTGFLPILGLLTPSSLLYGICLRGGEGRKQEVDHVECVTIAVLAFVNKLILGCDVEIYQNEIVKNPQYSNDTLSTIHFL